MMRDRPSENERLKAKCNRLIQRVKDLTAVTNEKDAEIATLRVSADVSGQAQHIGGAVDQRAHERMYQAVTQAISDMIREGEVIDQTKNSAEYLHIEASRFKERVTDLMPESDEKSVLAYCFTVGLLQRIGSSASTVMRHKSDEDGSTAPVRVYRLKKELVNLLEVKDAQEI